MNEKLLHFIWQHQYYDARGLTTVGGESVQVLQAGQFNVHQGPDFLNARLKINGVTWAGHVEMHVKTSDWIRHGHQKDRNYDNVILHVVWQHDMADDELPDRMQDMPVVSLEGRVSSLLLKRYEHLMKSRSFIPCGKMIADVKPLTWRSWKDRLLAERLQKKSERILSLLKENGMHWEETFWQLIARNFGIRQNADAFEEIARRLPLKIIARHKSNYFQIEAMLMGQAGLLNEELDDEYYIMLQKEYHFLRKKYQLQPIRQSVHFLRMRPSAFPTLRLAQLSALLHRSSRLFSKIQETSELKTIRSLFSVTPHDYWLYHYRFGKKTTYREKPIGNEMLNNLIINTFAPVLFAYGLYHNQESARERSLKWLEKTSAEKNSITRGFEQCGIENKCAFDSQALIELKNEYCSLKRCLECAVGHALLK